LLPEEDSLSACGQPSMEISGAILAKIENFSGYCGFCLFHRLEQFVMNRQ
jgi:hypothetical protein